MSGGEERLFVVMLGGRHPRGRTELHDVVFAFGRTLADMKRPRFFESLGSRGGW